MDFFRYFPTTLDVNSKVLVNLSKRVLLGKNLENESIIYQKYVLKNNERLDTLSKRLYGDEKYQWILMLVNGMFDPRENLPLNYTDFDDYLIDKYGSLEYTYATIHHYLDENGKYVNESYGGVKTSISVYEYEDSLNESKRYINIVRKEYISNFESELKRLFN